MPSFQSRSEMIRGLRTKMPNGDIASPPSVSETKLMVDLDALLILKWRMIPKVALMAL